jgi:predicted nucleic acid-binding protein
MVNVRSHRYEYPAAIRAACPSHASGGASGPRKLLAGPEPLCIAVQNVAEFWNAATRPHTLNGLGMTIEQAAEAVKRLEDFFEIVSESPASYAAWKTLLTTHRVSGAQVHDARLAAVMKAAGIARIVTFNVKDFSRFAGIEAVHPDEIA